MAVHFPYPGEPSSQGLCGQKVLNPDVPYRQALGCLYPGKMIFISGIPDPKSPRFSINLKSTNGQKKTNALHFDVRFDYGRDHDVVIRNSKIDGKWCKQENSMCRPFPFKHNDYFEVIILVEKSCFKVAVNDQHFIEYENRFPIEDIDTLRIRGDVRLTSVRVQG